MKINVLLLVSAIILSACNHQKQVSVVDDVAASDSLLCDSTKKKTLNDIRFAGWEYEDWLDNDYIRELRNYLVGYHKGEIADAALDDYRQDIEGKFVIANIEPYILGGAFIQVCFMGCPSKIFSSWVYSEVDEEKEIVTNYECRGLTLQTDDSGFSKERIVQIMGEHPEIKAW